MTSALHAIAKEDFADNFNELYTYCEMCIANKKHYLQMLKIVFLNLRKNILLTNTLTEPIHALYVVVFILCVESCCMQDVVTLLKTKVCIDENNPIINFNKFST